MGKSFLPGDFLWDPKDCPPLGTISRFHGRISSGGMYEYLLRVTDPLPILAYISFMIDWSAVCTARSNLRIIHQKSESRRSSDSFGGA